MEVTDNGPGMSEDTLKIFSTRFYTTKDTFGTGLGLYIVSSESWKRSTVRSRQISKQGEWNEILYCYTAPLEQST